jgi:hypothetical protein
VIHTASLLTGAMVGIHLKRDLTVKHFSWQKFLHFLYLQAPKASPLHFLSDLTLWESVFAQETGCDLNTDQRIQTNVLGSASYKRSVFPFGNCSLTSEKRKETSYVCIWVGTRTKTAKARACRITCWLCLSYPPPAQIALVWLFSTLRSPDTFGGNQSLLRNFPEPYSCW